MTDEASARARVGEQASPITGGDGKKDKVDKVVAEQEFMRFVDTMGLDVDEGSLTDEDKAGLNTNRSRMLKAIQNGSLVITENGEPLYTPQRSENATPLLFAEPEGSALMEMDRKKAGADVGKMFVIMGSIAHVPQGTFAKLKIGDLNVCMAITTLYLG